MADHRVPGPLPRAHGIQQERIPQMDMSSATCWPQWNGVHFWAHAAVIPHQPSKSSTDGIAVFLHKASLGNGFGQHSWLQQPARVKGNLECVGDCYREPCLCGEMRPRNLNSVPAFATGLLCKSPAHAGLQQPGTVAGITCVLTLSSLCILRSFRIFMNKASHETDIKLSVSFFCLIFLEVQTNTHAPLQGSKHRIVTMRKLVTAEICLALSSQYLYGLYLIYKCALFHIYIWKSRIKKGALFKVSVIHTT